MSNLPIRRALLSVSDKTGLVDFARELAERGVELISTGGTRNALQGAGLPVRDISEVTGFPEIMDGRVKTLHPRVHAGLLAVRDNPAHMATLAEQGIQTIDLVVCNLYPFEATLARSGSSHEEMVENIDIGGPSMIRAACKNYQDVVVAVEPSQYSTILQAMAENGGTVPHTLREELAGEAFARTAAYDAVIADYFLSRRKPVEGDPNDGWPARFTATFLRKQSLRYGENPHQRAAFYSNPLVSHACVASAKILHGKELSYNNILDLDSALNLVREFTLPASVVIKHNNPCGAAVAQALVEAFDGAYEGDPVSAFGGILGFNHEVDEATAMRITEPNRFIECIIAPSYSSKAFEILTTRPTWRKSLRLLEVGPLGPIPASELDLRRVSGGLLVQARDGQRDDFAEAKVVSQRQPTAEEWADLQFAWLVAKHVKSNAIVLAKDGRVAGVGAGQMSRIDSTHIAARKAGDKTKGCVLASDAFFPFRDNVDMAAELGVRAIAHPGGAKRDQDSIDACNERGIALVFTGRRHFRH